MTNLLLALNRQSSVPEGHATIAQRFNVGLISMARSSPEGTAETAREPSAVPSGLTTAYLSLPNVETLGYCRASLRDEEQALVALPGSTAIELTHLPNGLPFSSPSPPLEERAGERRPFNVARANSIVVAPGGGGTLLTRI